MWKEKQKVNVAVIKQGFENLCLIFSACVLVRTSTIVQQWLLKDAFSGDVKRHLALNFSSKKKNLMRCGMIWLFFNFLSICLLNNNRLSFIIQYLFYIFTIITLYNKYAKTNYFFTIFTIILLIFSDFCWEGKLYLRPEKR